MSRIDIATGSAKVNPITDKPGQDFAAGGTETQSRVRTEVLRVRLTLLEFLAVRFPGMAPDRRSLSPLANRFGAVANGAAAGMLEA